MLKKSKIEYKNKRGKKYFFAFFSTIYYNMRARKELAADGEIPEKQGVAKKK